MVKLDLQSRVPIYQQLKSRIVELILLGALAAGESLPSVRNMARDLGINPNTVAKAYQELEREGVIYSVAGKGSFISGEDQFSQLARAAAQKKLLEAIQECKLCGISLEDATNLLTQVYHEEGLTQ